jgi:hypothetical protein
MRAAMESDFLHAPKDFAWRSGVPIGRISATLDALRGPPWWNGPASPHHRIIVMNPFVQSPSHPSPLDASQVGLVLEMLDTRMLAPKETAARFFQLRDAAVFSAEQQEAVEFLFELDDAQIAEVLMTFADDEARDIVREQLAHEAHLDYVIA